MTTSSASSSPFSDDRDQITTTTTKCENHPATRDIFQSLASPWTYGPFDLLAILFILFQLSSLLFISYLPTLFYLSSFLLWRLSYNLFLAFLLYIQSHHSALTSFVTRSSTSPSLSLLLSWALSKPASPHWTCQSTPHDYNAWLLFRSIALVILANDGVAYVVAFIACFHRFQSWPTAALYMLAVAPVVVPLVYVSAWAKLKAHHILGDYGWFWGDFFYTRSQSESEKTKQEIIHKLSVFNVVPHPMYSLGYFAYYAMSLLARSYSLLLVSVIAHLLQFAFLYFVEQPHIDRIYGSTDDDVNETNNTSTENNSTVTTHIDAYVTKSSTSQPIHSSSSSSSASHANILLTPKPASVKNLIRDNPALRLFDQASPHNIIHFIFLAFSAIAVFVNVVVSFAINYNHNNTPVFRFVLIATFCTLTLINRLAYYAFVSKMLDKSNQASDDNQWIEMLRNLGTSHSRIFSTWQYALLVLNYANHLLFLITCILASSILSSSPLLSIQSITRVAALSLSGCTLLAVGLAVLHQCYKVTGKFSFYYGDFFISLNNNVNTSSSSVVDQKTLYSLQGPFKYLNHPSSVAILCCYLGISLATISFKVTFPLAIACYVLHACFITAIEVPHLTREYGHLVHYRDHSPCIDIILLLLPSSTAKWEAVQSRVRDTWCAAFLIHNKDRHADSDTNVRENDGVVKVVMVKVQKWYRDLDKMKLSFITKCERYVHSIMDSATVERVSEKVIDKLKSVGLKVQKKD